VATFRTIASAALASAIVIAGLSIAAPPAHACDSNYPWLCKPVPSIDPPETADSSKTESKPVKSASRRTRAAVKQEKEQAAAKTDNSRSEAASKRAARRAESRRERREARRARAAAARAAEESAEETETAEPERTPMPRPAPQPRVNAGSEPTTGFAVWTERIASAAQGIAPTPAGRSDGPAAAVPTEAPPPQPTAPVMAQATVPAAPPPAAAAPTAPPAAAAPAASASTAAEPPANSHSVPAASQNEVNEIDLAAKEPPGDRSWLRNIFIAMAGLLAVGSALRLIL
jgi:hypothetical protein